MADRSNADPSERRWRIPILLYHTLGSGPDRFSVPRGVFEEHIDLLVASGRQVLTLGELSIQLATGAPLDAPVAAITFDDGTADFYDEAWPILRERDLSATVYVISGAVGGRYGDSKMLSWEGLRELHEAGIEIGSHGSTHEPLDLLPLPDAATELVNSKLTLEDGLGAAVNTFAFPFGYHTKAVKRLLPRAGYASACAVKNRLSHSGDDRFALSRLTVTADTDIEEVQNAIAGEGPHTWTGERVRTRLWRSYRLAKRLASSSHRSRSASQRSQD